MAVVPDTPALYADLTVREHLELVAVAHGVADDGVDARIERLLLTADATNPLGVTVVVLWLLPWLLATVLITGGALLILGHAAAGHGSVILAGVIAFGVSAVACAVLTGVARGSNRPDG